MQTMNCGSQNIIVAEAAPSTTVDLVEPKIIKEKTNELKKDDFMEQIRKGNYTIEDDDGEI
jgi:hypothetical protein